MTEGIASLGDRRLDQTYYELIERVCNRMSLVVRQVSDGRSQEVRFGRLLRHDDLCLSSMIQMGVDFSMSDTNGRHILLVQDSSELSFGFEPFKSGLSEVGSGLESGFYIHPVIALDAQSLACLGLANVEVFKRVAPSAIHRDNVAFEDKQSYRWLSSIKTARKNCGLCKGATVVSDREGDIYDALCGYKTESIDFVIRSSHNRPLADRGLYLQEQIDQWAAKGSYTVNLPRTDTRSAHEALLEIKYGKVALKRPKKSVSNHLEKSLDVYVLEAKEHPSSVVNNEQPISWRIVTSHPVENMDDAKKIIHWYTKRWLIEQVFRVLKKQGLDITESQARQYETLSRLAVVGLIAAVRVLQLVTARDNQDDTPVTAAFTPAEVSVMEQLGPTLEGKTEIQKNPYPRKTMAFAVWVIARLGGWKSYSKSERPPGPITFLNGLKRLQAYMDIDQLVGGHSNSP